MSNQSIHEKWFSSMVDPSLSSTTSSSDSCEEKYVKHDQGYPDLENDLLSLKLDDRWEDINYDYADQWMTIDAFYAKYGEVFDEQDLQEGLALMKKAATKSRAAILANNLELPFQLYARLIGLTSEYEIVKKYLSSLIKIKSMPLLPLGAYWPHPNNPDYVAHYHDSNVEAVCFLHDKDQIIFGDKHGYVHIYCSEKEEVIDTLKGHTSTVSSISVSDDGRWIVSASHDHTVRIWDSSANPISATVLEGHTNWIRSVDISPDGRFIVSGSDDRTIRVWDTRKTPVSARILNGHTGTVTSVSMCGNGRWVVSGSWDGTVRVWEVRASTISEMVLYRHTYWVTSVSISSDGRWIASASNDHTIRVWDTIAKPLSASVLDGHTDPVTSVSISCDGRWIVSGSDDRTVRIWDTTATPISSIVLNGHSGMVTSVSMSRDGQWILSGSWDRTVRIWDTHTHQIPSNGVEGHTMSVTSVSMSRDGRWIVSGSRDRTVWLWDADGNVNSGRVLNGHLKWVTSVSISADGRWIASAGDDGLVLVWNRSSGYLRYVFLVGRVVESLSFTSSNCFIMHFDIGMASVQVQMDGNDLGDGSEMLTALSNSTLRHFQDHPFIDGISPRRQNPGDPHASASNGMFKWKSIFDGEEGKTSPTVHELYEYFNKFNSTETMFGPHREEDEIITIPAVDQNRSTESDVKIFCVENDVIRKSSSLHSASSECVSASSMPFYCKNEFIYRSDSNTRLARLPGHVQLLNSRSTYHENSKTLVVCLENHMLCFFRVNEPQDEMSLNDFMELRSDIFGTSVSTSDRCLFDYFKQSSTTIRMMNSCPFLDQFCDGLFIGSISAENVPKRHNIFEFRYSLSCEEDDDKEMVFMVDPYVLTPLGLSIMFWLLPITSTNHKLLKGVLKKMELNNCFSREVSGEGGTSNHTALVVPQTWALEYGLDNSFNAKHLISGKFGICIGMRGASSIHLGRTDEKNGSSSDTGLPRSSQNESRHGLMSWIKRGKVVALLGIVKKKIGDEGKEDPVQIGMLRYREHEQRKWRLKNMGMTFKTPILEADCEIGPMESSVELSSAGQSVEVVSLNQFVVMGMPSPYESLYKRMKWLEKVLFKIGLFPSDGKRGFLEQIMAKELRDVHPIKLLQCCSVKAGAFNRRECRQLEMDNEIHVLVPLPSSSTKYLAFSGVTNVQKKVIEVNMMHEMEVSEEVVKDKCALIEFELW